MAITNLPKYIQVKKSKKGITYGLNVPKKYVDLGIVKRETTRSITKAKRISEEACKAMQEYNKQYVRTITNTSTLTHLVNAYKKTEEYKNLADNTKKNYDYLWKCIIEDFHNCRVTAIDSKKAKFIYDRWCERGIETANKKLQAARLIYTYLVYQEVIPVSPFSLVKKRKVKPRKIVWTLEQVQLFLDTCFSEYKWRNVGLICNMAYEWGQRVGDMRKLTWDRFDEDFTTLHLEQSKTHAEVFLPISEDLREMLMAQKEEFGWDIWVAPNPRKIRGYHKPYTQEGLGMQARAIMRKCGLPEELQLRDIRRTVVTEMVEAGVPIPQLMATTGHISPASLAPYIKHTYDAANAALTQRLNHKKGKTNADI